MRFETVFFKLRRKDQAMLDFFVIVRLIHVKTVKVFNVALIILEHSL